MVSVTIDAGTYDSCLDAYNSGNTSSGYYPIDNGNISTDVYCDMSYSDGGWTQCFELVNTSGEDLTNNTWFNNCVDYSNATWSGAEIMVKLEDSAGNTLYQSHGSRQNAWTYDYITCTTSLTGQYNSGVHDYLVNMNNGDKLFISGQSASDIGYGGSFGNGYAVVVYPTNPNYYNNPKMIVASYQQYVSPFTGVRNFTGWTQNHEISYNGGSTFHTGQSTPAQLGMITFYIR